MKKMPYRAKKIAIVVFLTLLAWIWAYNALESELPGEVASLNIFETDNASTLVTFDKPAPIRLSVTISGPSSKVKNLRNEMMTGETKLDFIFNAEKEGKDKPGTYLLNVIELLNKSTKMQSLGLTIKDCTPDWIEVTVEELFEKELEVQCLDENGAIIKHDDIKPARVSMYVKADATSELLKANVTLTRPQIEKARKGYITAPAVVEIASGQTRNAGSVQIKLPSTEQALNTHAVNLQRIGYVLNPYLADKYKVELQNEKDLMSSITITATEEAFKEYDERTLYQVLVEVRDDDINAPDGIATREVIYNFPVEYIRNGQIELIQSPEKMAKFKLIEIGKE